MKINIAHIGSDEWFNFKSEIIYGLFHAFCELGYDVVITHNQLDKLRLNILVGADWLAKPEYLKFIKDHNLEYFIYEVEAVADGTINHRHDFDISAYLEIVERSKLVFTPYIFNQKAYQNLGYGGKTLYTKWGHYSQIVDPNIRRDINREYHGVFFGLLKGDRKSKLELLQHNLPGKVAVIGRSQPHLMRAYYLSKTDYAVSLSYGISEHFINPFRIQHLVSNGIPVICDSENDEDGYLDLAIRAKTLEEMESSLKLPPMSSAELQEMGRQTTLTSELKKIFA